MCDAGEKAVLTCYPRPYKLKNPDEGSEVLLNEGPPVAMCLKDFAQSDGLPRFKSRPIAKHSNKLVKPFESLFYAAGFNFSRG